MPEFKVAFIGFGNVGRALAHLMLEKTDDMWMKHDIRWRAVGIATRRGGMAIDHSGIDVLAAAEAREQGISLERFHKGAPLEDTIAFIQRCQADVIFENSYLNPETGQPALDYVRTALNNGMHVVTANKGPVVHGYRMLRDLAYRQRRHFFFESTVMDGTPIFSTFREGLPVTHVKKLRGVLNSTTNLILSMMGEGASYDEALAHAQAIGIAEADPTNDVEGWDSAVKVAALVNVIMDCPLAVSEIDRTGITGLTAAEVRAAAEAGTPIKLVCEAARQPGGGVRASVRPVALPLSDPLAQLGTTSSAVSFTMDTLKEIVITGIDPGPRQTAFGLLADFINAVRAR